VRRDRGFIFIGTLTKIAGLLAVLVIMFHDGISLGLAQVSADSDAQIAARAGAQAWKQTGDVQRSYETAALAVVENGSDVDAATFRVDPKDGRVTVQTRRNATTMAAKYFGWFDDLVNPDGLASSQIDSQ
jgi:hypothetical protein